MIPRHFLEDKKSRHRGSKIEKPQHQDSKTKNTRHQVSAEFGPLCSLIKHTRCLQPPRLIWLGRHTIKLEAPVHGTMKYKTPAEQQNTDDILEHSQNNQTLVENLECHGIAKQENTNRTMDQQHNTKKYYQYRTGTY